ncbi:centrosomal protein of 104 kDa isoform X7 [Symphalangus syndactylus]|uniref:centrosomal protein of 104 kDa isoform X7 n=1 Tax=Symphalangus syndactylus TaxID=9590 RepID=UPI003006F5B9
MPHKIGFVVVSSSGHEDGFSARELMIHAPTVSGWRSPSYVSLCDNEKTGCKARELKSVYVDAVGQFLKLIFHQNHVNKYNIYNQVALVAINIIGDPADFSDESNTASREKLIDHYLGHNSEDPALEGTYARKSDSISPLDDLAFDMYQDPEVAQIIRKLDERKREAVQKERYDYAKKLKQAIADLQKVGERLGRYEVEKRCAVEKEDYDLAKEKKQQMEQYRAEVYEQLELHSLLDAELMRRPFDLPLQPLARSGSPRHQKPMPLLPQREERGTENQFAEPFLQEKPSSYSLTISPQHSAIDQLLPATDPHPKINVAGAYSKTWSYREDALLALFKKLLEMPVGTPKEDLKNTLRASIFLIRRAIKDIVTSVFQSSLKLLKMIITQYIPKHKLSKLETAHCVERTIPVLLTRTGDSSARLRVTAANFIQEMALFKEVKSLQIIPSYLVQPLKANSSVHLAMSQMGLLARLLKDLGTGSSGFTTDNVMKFSVSALEHRVYEVRETAVRIILDMYRQHQASILEYLPPDDSNTRKNILYKTIFEGFAKIDGRPTDAEMRARRKAATEAAEKQKKEEIKALQGQLAALKEIQAEVQEKESDAVKPKNQDTQRGKAAPAEALGILDEHYLDNLCIFCGERSESFTEEGLDLHYWKHCLMLTRCDHCKQVVEISSLTEHLLVECDQKDGFGKCYRCSEAVFKEELPRHIKNKDCNPAKPEKLANRCPLCHENFSPGEEAWKAHLMGPAGCSMNLRKTHILQKAPALQPGKSSAVATSGPSGSKAGSKIPTPKGGLSKSSSRTHTKR